VVKRLLILVSVAWSIMVLAATPASAHAFLQSSSPADGADLAVAPTAVTLTFNEEVLPGSAEVTLYSGYGTVVARSGPGGHLLSIAGGSGGPPEVTLTVSLPRLTRGAFALGWQVQSADDLHRTAGSLVFGVGQVVAAAAVNRAGPLPAWGTVVLRWLDLIAIAAMMGALLLSGVVIPRTCLVREDRVRWMQVCRLVLRSAAGIAATAALVELIVSAGTLGRVGAIVWSTWVGRLLMVELAGLAGVFILGGGVFHGAKRAMTVGAAFVALVGMAATSHVGVGGDRPFADALLAVHLAVGSGWAGSVVVLATAAVHPRFRRQAAEVARAFALPAALCVALVVVTGLALGARQVASADALVSSNYGRVLIIKVVLVALAAALGLVTFRRLRRAVVRDSGPPGHAPGKPAPSDRASSDAVPVAQRNPAKGQRRGDAACRIAWEGSAMLLILGCAAGLSLASPPRGPTFAPAPKTVQARVVAPVDGLLVTFDLAPNVVGLSWARVTVDDTRRPAPAPITGVSLALAGPGGQANPDTVLIRGSGPADWQLGGIPLAQAGSWRATLTVHRSGRPAAVWETDWVVGSGPAGSGSPLVSDQPWAHLLNGLALIILVGCIGGLMVVTARTGRRRRRVAAGVEQVSVFVEKRGQPVTDSGSSPVDLRSAEAAVPRSLL
jgi:copper transport protein